MFSERLVKILQIHNGFVMVFQADSHSQAIRIRMLRCDRQITKIEKEWFFSTRSKGDTSNAVSDDEATPVIAQQEMLGDKFDLRGNCERALVRPVVAP